MSGSIAPSICSISDSSCSSITFSTTRGAENKFGCEVLISSFSSFSKISRDFWITLLGIPASLATSIPNESEIPPSAILRRKIIPALFWATVTW